MAPLLNEERLREQAASPRPELFSGIAADWSARLDDAVGRIRAADADELPAALHELRSGAVAVGLVELPAALAAIEQGVERGDSSARRGLDAALALAERSAAALDDWWAAAGRARAAPSGWDIDADLLRLSAGAAGLRAVALLTAADGGAQVRASWPGDARETRCDLTEAGCRSALGGDGPVVMALLGGEDARPRGAVCGVLAPGGDAADASRALATLAQAIGYRLELDDARRRAEEERGRMARLVQAGLSLGREARLDELLTRIVDAAREVLGARYAALGVLDATRTELSEFVTSGLTDEERAAIGEPPRRHGVLGALIEEGRPVRLERLTDDPRSVGMPLHHPPMEAFLGVPIALRGEAFGNLYLTDKVGGPFTEADQQIALTFAAQAAVAVDNVRRYEAERRRADEIESVHEVARAVLGTLDLDALLPMVARRARRLTSADTVGVAVRDGGELEFRHVQGADASALEGRRAPADRGGLEAFVRAAVGEAGVMEVIALEAGSGMVGTLVAVGSRAFDDGARRLLATFSSQVAIALDNARHVAAMRESATREAATAYQRAAAEGLRRAVAAQEGERARVARELHDEAGQVLTALTLHLRTLEADVPDGAARERVRELRGSVAAATRTLRDLAARLRPAALREQGLRRAIEEQVERTRALTGMAVEADLRGLDADLPEDVQVTLFRVVQEALTNVARHSGARNVGVVAAATEGRLRLVVDDDGRGFDPAARTAHLGLAGIRERVEMIGGTLKVEAAPGAGTAVVVDLELPR